MFKVIIPKIVFKELEKIDNTDRQLVFEKLKDLENGHFENDKSLQGKHKGKFRKRAGNYRIIYLCWDAKNLASARIHTWPPDA